MFKRAISATIASAAIQKGVKSLNDESTIATLFIAKKRGKNLFFAIWIKQ